MHENEKIILNHAIALMNKETLDQYYEYRKGGGVPKPPEEALLKVAFLIEEHQVGKNLTESIKYYNPSIWNSVSPSQRDEKVSSAWKFLVNFLNSKVSLWQSIA